MRQFTKGEREKQYNAVKGQNIKKYFIKNQPTIQFQPITSQIEFSQKFQKLINDIKSGDIHSNRESQQKCQIPLEVTLIIQKQPLGNDGKGDTQQNQQKKNRFQVDLDEKTVKRKNYLIIDNSELKNIQQTKNINKNSIKKQINKQLNLDQSKSQKNKQTIYELSQGQKQQQQLDDEEMHLEKSKKNIQNSSGKSTRKRNTSKVWTMSEMMKLIMFIHINKRVFQSKHQLYKGFFTKLCRYIGTDKTPVQCQARLFYVRKKNNNNITRMIEEQIKPLKFSQELIEREKKIIESLDNNEQPIFRCDVKIIAEIALLNLNQKMIHFDQNDKHQQMYKVNLPLTVEFYINKNEHQNDPEQNSNKHGEKQQNQSKSRSNKQEEKGTGIFYQSDSEQLKRTKGQIPKQKQINEEFTELIQQQDHGQDNTDCIQSKITIFVDYKVFQMLKISMKQKAQKQEEFSLVKQTDNYLVAKNKLKQQVQVIFTPNHQKIINDLNKV